MYFHVIHGVSVKKFESGVNLDSALIASSEGITWIYFSREDGVWYGESIGLGEMSLVNKTGYKGSGDVDAGKVGDDAFAYIPAVEPFHGNTVAVYYKTQETNESKNSLTGCQWQRTVLDVYGDPNALGEGPAHFVVCADFDNDGDDEFIVAPRAPMPWMGVFYYKAIDVKNGVFVKWRVSQDSADRIAVADFDGDGRLDFATIGYSVDGYFCADNPSIVVYYNDFALHQRI
ncbi:FG-GAP repeat domain-containing protein [Microseira sp. BLCC-F43]|uniref:FG-GAP repeat domain-containing protein n=1 Tax=Microseira sp. BLCC-F43 TaxID=3153602 RepID=UPI0035B974C0